MVSYPCPLDILARIALSDRRLGQPITARRSLQPIVITYKKRLDTQVISPRMPSALAVLAAALVAVAAAVLAAAWEARRR